MSESKSKKQAQKKSQTKESSEHDEGVPITILTFVGDDLRYVANLIGESAPATVELLKERKLTVTELMDGLKYVLGRIEIAKNGPVDILRNGPDRALGKAEEALSVLSRASIPLLNCYDAMYYRGAKADINLVYKRYVREYQEANVYREKLDDLVAWFHAADFLVWADSSSEEIPKDLIKVSIVAKKFKINPKALKDNIKQGKLQSYLFKDGRYIKRDRETTSTTPHYMSEAEVARHFEKKE